MSAAAAGEGAKAAAAAAGGEAEDERLAAFARVLEEVFAAESPEWKAVDSEFRNEWSARDFRTSLESLVRRMHAKQPWTEIQALDLDFVPGRSQKGDATDLLVEKCKRVLDSPALGQRSATTFAAALRAVYSLGRTFGHEAFPWIDVLRGAAAHPTSDDVLCEVLKVLVTCKWDVRHAGYSPQALAALLDSIVITDLTKVNERVKLHVKRFASCNVDDGGVLARWQSRLIQELLRVSEDASLSLSDRCEALNSFNYLTSGSVSRWTPRDVSRVLSVLMAFVGSVRDWDQDDDGGDPESMELQVVALDAVGKLATDHASHVFDSTAPPVMEFLVAALADPTAHFELVRGALRTVRMLAESLGPTLVMQMPGLLPALALRIADTSHTTQQGALEDESDEEYRDVAFELLDEFAKAPSGKFCLASVPELLDSLTDLLDEYSTRSSESVNLIWTLVCQEDADGQSERVQELVFHAPGWWPPCWS